MLLDYIADEAAKEPDVKADLQRDPTAAAQKLSYVTEGDMGETETASAEIAAQTTGVPSQKGKELTEEAARQARAMRMQEIKAGLDSDDLDTAVQAMIEAKELEGETGISPAAYQDYIDEAFVTKLEMEAPRPYLTLEALNEFDGARKTQMLMTEELNYAINQGADNVSVMDAGLAYEVLPEIAPFFSNFQFAKVIEQATGMELSVWEHFSRNAAGNAWKTWLQSATPTEQRRMAELVLAGAAGEGVTDLNEWTSLRELIDGAYVDNKQGVENLNRALFALDATVVGGIIKKGVLIAKGVEGLTKSAAKGAPVATPHAVSKIDPIVGGKMQEQALNSETAAKGLGYADSAEATLGSLPKATFTDEQLTSLPDATRAAIQKADAITESAYGTSTLNFVRNYTEEEVITSIQKAADKIKDATTAAEVDARTGASRVLSHNTDTGVTVFETALTNKLSGTTVFTNKKKALDMAKKLERQLLNHPDAKVFVTTEGKGQHFVKVQETVYMGGDDLLADSRLSKGVLGFFNSWLNDASSVTAQFVQRAKNQSLLRTGSVEAQVSQLIRPYTKLNKKTRSVLDEMLTRGSLDEVVYTPEELMAATAHLGEKAQQKAVVAYYSTRRAFDLDYTLKDRAWIQTLNKEGYKYYANTFDPVKPLSNSEIEKLDFSTAKSVGKDGKVKGKIADEDGNILDKAFAEFLDEDDALYMAINGNGVDIVDALDSVGYTIGKLRGQKWVKGQPVEYILIKDTKRVVDIPKRGVLPYKAGHMPVGYKGNFFVKFIADSGAEATRKNFMSQTEANTWAAEMNAKAEAKGLKGRYRVDLSGELQKVQGNQSFNVDDLYYERTQLAQRTDPDLLASPAEVMSNMLSRDISMTMQGNTVEMLKQRWLKNYGHLVSGKTVPLNADEIGNAKGLSNADMELVKEAQAAYQHLRMYHGYNTKSDMINRQIYLRIANSLDNMAQGDYMGNAIVRRASEAMYGAARTGNANVGSLLKNAAFTTQIALNPIRQLVLQSQHYMFMSGIDPSSMATAVKNGGWFLGTDAMLSGGDMSKLVKHITKIGGKESADNFVLLSDRFKRSGLSMIGNSIQVDDITQTITGGLLSSAKNKLQRVGFEYGETNARGQAFAFAAVRAEKKLGKSMHKFTDEEWANIASDSLELALNLTKSSGLQYQRGIFSVMSQYLAIRHKGLLAVTSNKQLGLTRGQRARWVGLNTVLMGLEGTGIYTAANGLYQALTGKPIDDTGNDHVDNAIAGGVMDLVFNAVISAGSDEVSQVSISASVSPLAGLDEATLVVPAMLDAAFFDDQTNRYKPPLTYILGASATPITKTTQLISTIGELADQKLLFTPDGGRVILRTAAEILPAINNPLNKVIFEDGMAYTASRTGGKDLPLTTIEGGIKALAGFSNANERDFYRLKRSVKSFEGDVRKAVQENLTVINNSILRTGNMEQANVYMMVLREAGKTNPDARIVYEATVRAFQNPDNPASAELLRTIQNKVHKHGSPNITNELMKTLRNLDPDDPRIQQIEHLLEMYEENGRDLL